MRKENRYSSWYDKFRNEQEPDKKAPYRVLKIENDIGVPVSGMEDVRVEAYSPAQARVLFLKKYPRLNDYLSMGFQVEVELDSEMLRQRRQIAEMERQHQEENIQNAWWQD